MVDTHTCEVGVTLAPFISVSRICVWYMTDLGKICKIFKGCFVESKITWQLYIVFFFRFEFDGDLCARGLDNMK
jgi:hypothetical protein